MNDIVLGFYLCPVIPRWNLEMVLPKELFPVKIKSKLILLSIAAYSTGFTNKFKWVVRFHSFIHSPHNSHRKQLICDRS